MLQARSIKVLLLLHAQFQSALPACSRFLLRLFIAIEMPQDNWSEISTFRRNV
jgi:hypothetical protein